MLKSTDTTAMVDTKTGLTIYPEREKRITKFADKLLKDFYLKKDEDLVQNAFARASFAWANGDKSLAQRLYDGVSKGWFMFASPVLSNAPEVVSLSPLEFTKPKGLPISCFLTWVPDSVPGLINHSSEIRWLSILGGGVGGHWRNVRAVSEKAPGTIPFLHTIDADMEAYKQGSTRRGSYAGYQDIDHPDILEFISLRVPTGDASRKAHSAGFHHGVNITDKFMEAVEKNEDWDFIDPNDKTVRGTMPARKLWEQILDIRYRTGEPYLHFIDAANRALPEAQKNLGLRINGSNLCVTGDTVITIQVPGEDARDMTIADFVSSYDNTKRYMVKAYQTAYTFDIFADVVNAAKTGDATALIKIVTKSGKEVQCTEDHQVFTTNRSWVEAKDLTTNDKVKVSDNGFPEDITSVTTVNLTASVPVYDLTVGAVSNFYANGIVVHNCAEIDEPTNEDRTAVCCLSSLNLEKYDEWKGTTIVQDLIKMLDNVITYFIKNAPDEISKARYSATRERSLGLGVMGFHFLLQKSMVPFESDRARALNKEIFEHIDAEAKKASIDLGIEYGEAPDLVSKLTFHTHHDRIQLDSSDMIEIKRDGKKDLVRGFQVKIGDKIQGHEVTEIDGLHADSGRRNVQLTAIAPTANSAILVDSSPSIEPLSANAFMHQTRGGNFPVKNKYLETLLEEKGKNTEEIWQDIVVNKGSIQHLDIFTDEEKRVFKTAIEINQMWVITHAADRQEFITQSQSVNLFFPPRCSRNYFHRVHHMAWKKGMKSLYYTRTITPNRVESISTKIARVALKDGDEYEDMTNMPVMTSGVDVPDNKDDGECLACQG